MTTLTQISDQIATRPAHTLQAATTKATALALLLNQPATPITHQEQLRSLLLNGFETWQQFCCSTHTGQAETLYRAWLLILSTYRNIEINACQCVKTGK